MNAAAYARQLKQLLPRGAVWSLVTDSWLSKFLLGIADELARIDGRGGDLIEELDPSTTEEMLADWERVLGITPAAGATTADRQFAVAAGYVARGGSTAAYFEQVANRMGFAATVTNSAEAHKWIVTVDLAASTNGATLVEKYFRAGSGRAGDRLYSRSVPVLESVINRLKPAHTQALFVYEE